MKPLTHTLRSSVWLVLIIACSSIISGCTGQVRAQKELDWFVGQGTKLDDCGPASAAMAVNWAGGHSNLRLAKASTRDSGWWLFKDIAQHLKQQGMQSKHVHIKQLHALLRHGDGAILRTTVLGMPHFVFVSSLNERNYVLVADPLHGEKRIPLSHLQTLALDSSVLAIRNTADNPISDFDLNTIPWLKSSRADVKRMGRPPPVLRPAVQSIKQSEHSVLLGF